MGVDLLLNTEMIIAGCYVSSITRNHGDAGATATHGTRRVPCPGAAAAHAAACPAVNPVM